MHRRILLAILLAAPLAMGQAPSIKLKTHSVPELQAGQRALVGQWCRMDFEGSRLSDNGWKKFEPLTTIKLNPDFAAIYVVSRYQMDPPQKVSMEATVDYNVIGRYESGVGYVPSDDIRSVTFKFAEKEGELQIVDVDPAQPNVSKPVFIAWIKAQLAAAKSAADKTALQQTLNLLVPPPPKPKTEEGSSSSKQPQ